MKKMAIAAVQKPDFKVWCEHCSIRIAPNEQKVESGDKFYHQRCYSKSGVAVAKVISSKKVAGGTR